MSISKFNAERYYDPTTYEALTNIEREERLQKRKQQRPYMPKVYICSPFSGDTKLNIRNARRYCAFAVKSGYIPYASHLFFPQFLSDDNPKERELGIFMGTVFLDGCKECWVFGSNISSGMAAEIRRAERKDILVRYFGENCVEVFK